jgi:pantetheine-phosphate adenylyltransferase
MQVTAIYPGTFDPITMGHSDIVIRASKLFSRVIIAVADGTSKSTLFTTEERTRLVELALEGAENIEIMSFKGLVTEFARENDAGVIVRGLRAVSDFEYEFQMAGMN